MSYTISQAAQMTGISPSAIRYYDKEGLLPQVERKNGIRLFSDMDIRWLHLLTCLKKYGHAHQAHPRICRTGSARR